MATMLSVMHHTDGTHYGTGLSEVRKYVGEFQN